MSVRCFVAAVLFVSTPVAYASGSPVELRETFTSGGQYHVAIREEASGELRLPAEGDKPAPPPLKVKGRGAQEYDERILDAGSAENPAPRTLRIYRRVELERTVDEQAQESTLRPAVRRLVILINGHRAVPFSPDG